MKSVRPWLEELLEHYKVLIYNGQLDIIVAYPLTKGYLKVKFLIDLNKKTINLNFLQQKKNCYDFRNLIGPQLENIKKRNVTFGVSIMTWQDTLNPREI